MSLGALGEYGSDSSISDSGGEGKEEDLSRTTHKSSPVKCVDPLHIGGAVEGDSDTESSSSSASLPLTEDVLPSGPSLPLPDIETIVARNVSCSGSELHSSASPKSTTTGQQRDGVEVASSVFTNPYDQAEAAKLAILKKHVVDFDKKPATRGPSPPPRSKKHSRKRRKPPSVFLEGRGGDALFDDNDSSLGKKEHKHRCGVSDSLQPPKKYMQMYDRVYK